MFYYRDLLSKNLKKQELYSLLEYNKQENVFKYSIAAEQEDKN